MFQIASVFRLTRDSPSFKDELDIMKFICKDFWTKVFRRQVDNLRTNHQVNQQGSRGTCCWTTSWQTSLLVSLQTKASSASTGYVRPPRQQVLPADSALQWEAVPGSGSEGSLSVSTRHCHRLSSVKHSNVSVSTCNKMQFICVVSPSVPCFFMRRGERSSV